MRRCSWTLSSALLLALAAPVEENASLAVSQLLESVEVTAEAAVVDTSSNEVGSNFDRNWVEWPGDPVDPRRVMLGAKIRF